MRISFAIALIMLLSGCADPAPPPDTRTQAQKDQARIDREKREDKKSVPPVVVTPPPAVLPPGSL